MANAATFILTQAGLGAVPLLFAGFGELLAQRAGVINVGIEGTMLAGAFAAYAAAIVAGNVSAAIPAAILAGVAVAALFAVATVWFRADQIVAGTAINILAAGVTTTALSLLDEYSRTHPSPPMYEPFAASQYALFYWAIPVGAAIFFVMSFTRWGLVIRGLGDAPDACNAAGISVRMWRTMLILLAGALAGLAGAYLSTMRNHSFQINMTSGRGFLVLALVIFGRWNMAGFVAGVFAFSLVDGLRAYLLSASNAGIYSHALEMLPYAATLVALAFLGRARAGPILSGASLAGVNLLLRLPVAIFAGGISKRSADAGATAGWKRR